MARVRFWSEDGEYYVSLQVETDGNYFGETKVTIRRNRLMPPRNSNVEIMRSRSSAEMFMDSDTTQIATELLAFCDDLEEILNRDNKAMIILGRPQQGAGYQVSVKYNGRWSNYPGSCLLEAMEEYVRQCCENITPPSPPQKGGRE